jgi:hypothetical protein
MYALSTIVMQHREFFHGTKTRAQPDYKVVKEVNLPTALMNNNAEAFAANILKQLDLEGAHRVRGSLTEGSLVIQRDRPIGSYRITWEAAGDKVTVEKQEFGLAFFLEMLHRRRGFNQPFWANDAWAVIVDFVILAILTWAFTGIWMWWRMKSTHKLGTLCMILGSAAFAFFIFTI